MSGGDRGGSGAGCLVALAVCLAVDAAALWVVAQVAGFCALVVAMVASA